MTTEDRTKVTRPMNGEEYLESIRDGREVWIYGERIEDVTTYPVGGLPQPGTDVWLSVPSSRTSR